MRVHKDTVLLVLLGRFLLCYCCFMGKWKNTKIAHICFYGMMLMMLLQLPGFWSWAAAAVVVVAIGNYN